MKTKHGIEPTPITIDSTTLFHPAWLLKEAKRMAKAAGLTYESHMIRVGQFTALQVTAKDKAGWISTLSQTL